MKIKIPLDPIPEGIGYKSNQTPDGGYYKQLPQAINTILFYPDSENPTFIGVNANANANPATPNWKIYTITYNPGNPGFYTSITVTIGAWNSLPI